MEPSDKLSGGGSERLQEALLAAFPTGHALARMVRVGLGENLETIAAPGNLRHAAFELVCWAEAQGRLEDLIASARKQNPGNPLLRAFAEEPADERVTAPFHVAFPSNPAFVGRDEDLRRLHELLEQGSAVGVRPAALTGMGGIGKTQLAIEYAYRYAHAYPGGVYWVNAAGNDWRPALAKLAVELDLEARAAHAAERQIRLIAALASYLRERPGALVIFDNVDRPADLRSDGRAGLVPVGLGVHLLFTTRRRGDDDGRFGCVEVSVLPEDAALELLLSSPGRRPLWEKRKAPEVAAEVAAARAICRALGALPLAVALAAAFLGKNPKVTLAGYSSRIAKHGLLPAIDTNRVTSSDLATSHVAAVETTLALQWEALESEDARLTLRAAALFDEAQQIPRARLSLLTGLAAVAEEGFVAPMDGALQELSGLSLVEDVEETKALRLHPLVRAFARGRVEAQEAFAASCSARLGEALWDMRRLHREVAGRGIYAVLADLRIGSKLAGAPGQAHLEALIRPLDRESDALRTWRAASEPGFLLQQLRNRCFELGLEEVRERAESTLAEQRWAWLRERIRTSRESQARARGLEGPTSPVTSVAVTSDGRSAISACLYGTLKVWDLATGHTVRALGGRNALVNGVAVTTNNRFAISASWNKTLTVWDLETGHMVRSLEGHTASVNGVVVTSDGRFAVSASDDKTLNVWDLATGDVVHTLCGHICPVAAVAVTLDGRLAISASWDTTLKVWDLATGHLVRTLRGHVEFVTSVAVTSDGRFAVSASLYGSLKVWDLDTGHLVRTLKKHFGHVIGVAVTSDGRFAVSASQDGTLRVWDLAKGRLLMTLETSERLRCCAITPDGKTLLAGDDAGALHIIDWLDPERPPVAGSSHEVAHHA